jgi:hypothetical protein
VLVLVGKQRSQEPLGEMKANDLKDPEAGLMG